MHTTSQNNIKFDEGIVKRIIQAVHIIKAWAGENLVEICIFGSFAKQKQHKYSSIDMLVIICESNERFVKRKAELERILNEDDMLPLIDPLVYTEEEIMDLINKKESFIDSAINEAIVVWNDFNEINPAELNKNTFVQSRYLGSRPKLENII